MVRLGDRRRSTLGTMNPSWNVLMYSNKSNLRKEIISVSGTSKKCELNKGKYGDQWLGRVIS